MCGIAGVMVSERVPLGTGVLDRVTPAIAHRGPDGTGHHLDDRAAMSHARLSILDPSDAGRQPMRRGDSVLVHNGEIYNFLELRRELADAGHRFETDTDTEVMLAAIEAWGLDGIRRFVGMWAFAHLDLRTRRLVLSRDRLGVKPLYYRQLSRGVAFASEVPALVGLGSLGEWDAWSPEPDLASVRDFLVRGLTDHTDRTFVNGIRALPAGHHLVVEGSDARLVRYWDPPRLSTDARPASVATLRSDQRDVEEFTDRFRDAVRLHLRTDVPIGTCLSGGLDSSAIVAIAAQFVGRRGVAGAGEAERTAAPRFAFHARFRIAAIDESTHAAAVADRAGSMLAEVEPKVDSLLAALLPVLVTQGEPFLTSSVLAQHALMGEVRRRGVKVVLDGQGADELLGGYAPYATVRILGLARGGHPAAAARLARSLDRAPGLGGRPRFASLLRAFAGEGAVDRLRTGRLARLGVRPGPALAGRLEPIPMRRGEGTELGRLLWRDLTVSSLPALLRYEDRNSMRFGVEARVPFLDHRLVEFVTGLPDRLKIGSGGSKLVLRRAMDGHLPDTVIRRQDKLGFASPESAWMRLAARDVRDLLHDGQLVGRGLIRVLPEPRLESTAGVATWWRLLVLEAWLRLTWPDVRVRSGSESWKRAQAANASS